jgi:hypothetical protein
MPYKNVLVASQEGYITFRGGFWNYFSMGKTSILDQV